jgi:hypothetical protein
MEGHIDELGGGWDAEDVDIADSDTLADKVEVDLHVLHAIVLDGIDGEIDSADVVTVYKSGARKRAMKLLEQPLETEHTDVVTCRGSRPHQCRCRHLA